MKLVGPLNSPYVRRVAICLDLLEVPFVHEDISVFGDFEKFQQVNPVVKAPSLVCDNGEVLVESALILQFIEATHPQRRSLWSFDPQTLQHEMRITGLGLVACEKSIQIVYETRLRPEALCHAPWLTRLQTQLIAAYRELNAAVQQCADTFIEKPSHASVTAAVAWQFSQHTAANLIPSDDFPALERLSQAMDKLPSFNKYQGPVKN